MEEAMEQAEEANPQEETPMDPPTKGKDDVNIYDRYYSSTMRRELHNKCTPPPKIVKHTGTIYGQDISNELHNRKVVSIDKPQHTKVVL